MHSCTYCEAYKIENIGRLSASLPSQQTKQMACRGCFTAHMMLLRESVLKRYVYIAPTAWNWLNCCGKSSTARYLERLKSILSPKLRQEAMSMSPGGSVTNRTTNARDQRSQIYPPLPDMYSWKCKMHNPLSKRSGNMEPRKGLLPWQNCVQEGVITKRRDISEFDKFLLVFFLSLFLFIYESSGAQVALQVKIS